MVDRSNRKKSSVAKRRWPPYHWKRKCLVVVEFKEWMIRIIFIKRDTQAGLITMLWIVIGWRNIGHFVERRTTKESPRRCDDETCTAIYFEQNVLQDRQFLLCDQRSENVGETENDTTSNPHANDRESWRNVRWLWWDNCWFFVHDPDQRHAIERNDSEEGRSATANCNQTRCDECGDETCTPRRGFTPVAKQFYRIKGLSQAVKQRNDWTKHSQDIYAGTCMDQAVREWYKRDVETCTPIFFGRLLPHAVVICRHFFKRHITKEQLAHGVTINIFENAVWVLRRNVHS